VHRRLAIAGAKCKFDNPKTAKDAEVFLNLPICGESAPINILPVVENDGLQLKEGFQEQ
jgi:hypothetical protein